MKCTDDASCANSGGGGKCLGGKCGQCATDTDCGGSSSDLMCVSGKCKPPCQGDGDCSGFDRCLQGRCIEGGCQTNRECIAATRNVEATCGTDGKCIVPCQTDLECGNPKGYTFFSCVGGQCLYMGCESDKDCRLLFGSGAGSSGGTSRDDQQRRLERWPRPEAARRLPRQAGPERISRVGTRARARARARDRARIQRSSKLRASFTSIATMRSSICLPAL